MKRIFTLAAAAVLAAGFAVPVSAARYVADGAKVKVTEISTEQKKADILKQFKSVNTKSSIFADYAEIRDVRTVYNADGEETAVQYMTIFPNTVDDNLNADYEDSKTSWALSNYIKYEPKAYNKVTNYNNDLKYGTYNYQKIQSSIYNFHFFDFDKYDMDIEESDGCYIVTAVRTVTNKYDSYLAKMYRTLLGIPSKYTELDTTVTFTVDKESLEYTAFDIEVGDWGTIHTDCQYVEYDEKIDYEALLAEDDE